MPGEEIDRANPQALASLIPDAVLELSIKLQTLKLEDADLKGLELFRRASNYIAAAMIFLSDNAYLERDLTFDDIKPRLLGHWGTCPGLTLVYAHLNYLTRKNNLDTIYVVGPGHGAPAILASLWLEGSLERFYPQYTQNKQGLHNLITGFSTPHGFPSHINAETPGAIHEGGELGYALSVSFGAVMDNPDLIVACIVGDGEAETGPTAAAWHAAKYIDPAESGAVIPIVHVNGFKISERTIYGCMDDKEMWALDEIHKIQKAARSGKPIMKPRWPVLIMRTPKGWSGPKIVDGEYVEGSFHAHQVPLMAAKSNKDQLADLQKWLLSYKPSDLFTELGSPVDAISNIIPLENEKKLGQRAESYKKHETLNLPDWQKFGVEKGGEESCMKTIGNFLDQALVDNPKSLRIFSPDEHTGRNFQWDEFSHAQGGRVIEILSEHTSRVYFPPDAHPHSLSDDEFASLFTPDKPIFFNYHGYSNEIRGLLFGRPNLERVSIGCYKEEGSTTTPFDMMLRNGVSRYHICEAAIKGGARVNEKVALDMVSLLAEVKHQVVKVQEYIMATGKDPEGTFDIPKFPGTVFEEGKKGSSGSGSKEDGFFVN
ncbi:putative phosphoketolase [Glarea lozoyensis 74030]|uniref:Putative phosphoketolase n=1 Tax=Glarea lozoyensis (strain ATCC 74030 / MF5533) TaxID=1104152 RepID=H0EYQ4_GLAL7|nr:putative phosphoketolase [Glarea lozoyensis 74030]